MDGNDLDPAELRPRKVPIPPPRGQNAVAGTRRPGEAPRRLVKGGQVFARMSGWSWTSDGSVTGPSRSGPEAPGFTDRP